MGCCNSSTIIKKGIQNNGNKKGQKKVKADNTHQFSPDYQQLDILAKRRINALSNKDKFYDELQMPQFVGHKPEKMREEYDIQQALGQGAFGEVCKCVHKSSKEVRAIKLIKKSQLTRPEKLMLFTEIESLRTLEHPNILQLYESFEDDVNFYIVTELCEGGELFDEVERRGRFSERDAIDVMKALLAAINYCHQNNIMHRDLKPENILLESKRDFSQIKIIDFGASKQFQNAELIHKEFVGTAIYVAPEVIKRAHSYHCDLWCCGVIAYILLSGQMPFWHNDEEKLFKQIQAGQFDFKDRVWKKVSKQAQDFIKKLIVIDVNQRLTADMALKHPWLNQKSNANSKELISEASLAFENIIKFNQFSRMKQIVYSFIVQQQVSKKEKESYRKVFQAIDVDNNGVLSQQEFLRTANQFFGESLTKDQALNLFMKADSNGNGSISFNEFVLATMDQEDLHNQQKLKAAFSMLDKNNDGSIQPDEILEVFQGNPMFNIDQAKKIISELDVNKDGKIEYSEFEKFMRDGDNFTQLNEDAETSAQDH